MSWLLGRSLVLWLYPDKLQSLAAEVDRRRRSLLSFVIFLRVRIVPCALAQALCKSQPRWGPVHGSKFLGSTAGPAASAAGVQPWPALQRCVRCEQRTDEEGPCARR